MTDAKFQAFDGGGGVAGGIASGLKGLGAAGSDFANAQQDLSLARVRDLDLQYRQGAEPILRQYGSLEGKDALNAREGTVKALTDLRDNLASQVKPSEKEMFGRSVGYRYQLDMSDVDLHHTKQEKAYGVDVSKARLEQTQSDAIGSASDPQRFGANVATGLDEIDHLYGLQGLPPEAAKVAKTKYLSDIHSAVIHDKLANNDVDGAQAWYNDHKGELDWKDQYAVDTALKPALFRRDVVSAADGITGQASSDGGTRTQYGDPLHGAGTGVSDGYGAPREGGKTHNGVDFTGKLGTPIYSMGAGHVTQIGHDPKSGTFVMVDHGDGTTSSYSHLGSVKVQQGDEVTPDTQLGAIGLTGHTTGPHVHVVVRENGQTVDPQKVIGRALQAPQRHDLNTELAQVDARAERAGWSFEMRDAVKTELRNRAALDEQLLGRQEDDAKRQALDVVDRLGDNFKDVSQIPATLFQKMSPSDRIALRNQAESNAKGESVPANGDTVVGLHVQAVADPNKFAQQDLRIYRNQMTRSEFAELAELQARVRSTPKAPAVVQHEAIWSMINRYAPDLSLTVGAKASDEDRKKAMRIFSIMKDNLEARTSETKRPPTDDEVKAAFDKATMDVVIKDQGWFGGDKDAHLYEVQPGQRIAINVPNVVRDRIIASYGRRGIKPSEDDIARTYVQFKNRPGFWQ